MCGRVDRGVQASNRCYPLPKLSEAGACRQAGLHYAGPTVWYGRQVCSLLTCPPNPPPFPTHTQHTHTPRPSPSSIPHTYTHLQTSGVPAVIHEAALGRHHAAGGQGPTAGPTAGAQGHTGVCMCISMKDDVRLCHSCSLLFLSSFCTHKQKPYKNTHTLQTHTHIGCHQLHRGPGAWPAVHCAQPPGPVCERPCEPLPHSLAGAQRGKARAGQVGVELGREGRSRRESEGSREDASHANHTHRSSATVSACLCVCLCVCAPVLHTCVMCLTLLCSSALLLLLSCTHTVLLLLLLLCWWCRKQSAYRRVLSVLDAALRDDCFRQVKGQLAAVLEPARSSVFDEIIY